MFSLSRITLLFFLLIAVSGADAQQIKFSPDKVYGSDPLLYNGKFYTFNPPENTGGSQFLSDRQFNTGSATLRGVTYSGLLLNYDTYNQQLILKCDINTGATYKIIVSDAWLEAFSFNGMDFKIITIQDTLKQIFQVIGTGPKYILYSWKKELKLDNTFGGTNHTFTASKREMNLFTDSLILNFRNNKSFYMLFDPGRRNAVKEYLRKHHIRVKKSTDKLMTELINYCNSF
jgi:hypothetical protein